MTLIEETLFGTIDKVKTAFEQLKSLEPVEGYYLAFSGGKDSVVIKVLADMAGVKYDAHYSVTGIDPPELVRFIRDECPNVAFEHNKRPFFIEFMTNGFPLRHHPWCCKLLKERAGGGRVVLTGIRSSESPDRAKRKPVEHCLKGSGKVFVHIIHSWSWQNVWDFIKQNDIPYCKLYDEGYKRLGCLFCPNKSAHLRRQEMKRWPGYEKAFRRVFRKYHEKRKGAKSVDRWPDGDAMFDWWISNEPIPKKDDNRGLYA